MCLAVIAGLSLASHASPSIAANSACCRSLRAFCGSKPICGAAGYSRITKRTPLSTERIVSPCVPLLGLGVCKAKKRRFLRNGIARREAESADYETNLPFSSFLVTSSTGLLKAAQSRFWGLCCRFSENNGRALSGMRLPRFASPPARVGFCLHPPFPSDRLRFRVSRRLCRPQVLHVPITHTRHQCRNRIRR